MTSWCCEKCDCIPESSSYSQQEDVRRTDPDITIVNDQSNKIMKYYEDECVWVVGSSLQSLRVYELIQSL